MKIRAQAFFFLGLTAIASLAAFPAGCKALETIFSTVHIAAGLEQSSMRFFTKKSQLQQDTETFLSTLSGKTINRNSVGSIRVLDSSNVVFHSESRVVSSGFYTLSSPPAPFPFAREIPFLRLFSYSVTLSSPRIFRGSITNYPDNGRVFSDPATALANLTYPWPPLLSRSMEYQYIEYNIYATLYIGYFGWENFYIGLGLNWGQSRYNLEILETNYRVSQTIGRWRPMTSSSFTLGYRLGKHFPDGLLSNTFLFLDTTGEFSSRHPLHTELITTNGQHPDPLYLNTNSVRIGIRKTIDLLDGCDCNHRPPAQQNTPTQPDVKPGSETPGGSGETPAGPPAGSSNA